MAKKRKNPTLDADTTMEREGVPEAQAAEAREPELPEAQAAEAREPELPAQAAEAREPELPEAQAVEVEGLGYEALPETAPYPQETVVLVQEYDPAEELRVRELHISKLVTKVAQLEEQIATLTQERERVIASRCAEQAVQYAKTTETLMAQIAQLRSAQNGVFTPVSESSDTAITSVDAE